MLFVLDLCYNLFTEGDCMRLRKVKGASEEIDNSLYVIKDYCNYKGKFNTIFSNNNPIYIEIGMGKGKFIIENARRYPDINFIGIEKFDSVLVRAIQSVGDEVIPNLKFIRMDAKEISNVFNKEISKIYLNFSDPWPKERHAKRRLSSKNFLVFYDNIFKNKKIIEMKTDNRLLFEYSLKSFLDYGYNLEDISLDLHNSDYPNNILTEYEEKFSKKGQVIYYCSVKK